MRKTFSITDQEVLNKLEEVGSQSQYVQGLIIKDIYKGQAEGDYEAGILSTIETLEACLKNIKDNIKGE